MPELLSDPRFETNLKRCENHQELKPIIEEWSRHLTIDEAVTLLNDAGVPAAPINGLKRVTEDEHIAEAREMFVSLPHPVIGDMKVNGNPVKLMDTKVQISRPAPALGQDTEDVLSALLGLNDTEIEELKTNNYI